MPPVERPVVRKARKAKASKSISSPLKTALIVIGSLALTMVLLCGGAMIWLNRTVNRILADNA